MGYRQVGKAAGFGPAIRRFESFYPRKKFLRIFIISPQPKLFYPIHPTNFQICGKTKFLAVVNKQIFFVCFIIFLYTPPSPNFLNWFDKQAQNRMF